jgi:rhodanese-related sulfurtransferase
MKKSLTLILSIVGVIILFALLYMFMPKNISGSKNTKQAAVIQAVEYDFHLPADVFLSRIKEPNMTTIDVRTPEEFESGHIDGAINIDFYASDFTEQLGKLNKNNAYSIYCRSGSRTATTLSIMKDLGFTNAADLKGGYSSLLK